MEDSLITVKKGCLLLGHHCDQGMAQRAWETFKLCRFHEDIDIVLISGLQEEINRALKIGRYTFKNQSVITDIAVHTEDNIKKARQRLNVEKELIIITHTWHVPRVKLMVYLFWPELRKNGVKITYKVVGQHSFSMLYRELKGICKFFYFRFATDPKTLNPPLSDHLENKPTVLDEITLQKMG